MMYSHHTYVPVTMKMGWERSVERPWQLYRNAYVIHWRLHWVPYSSVCSCKCDELLSWTAIWCGQVICRGNVLVISLMTQHTYAVLIIIWVWWWYKLILKFQRFLQLLNTVLNLKEIVSCWRTCGQKSLMTKLRNPIKQGQWFTCTLINLRYVLEAWAFQKGWGCSCWPWSSCICPESPRLLRGWYWPSSSTNLSVLTIMGLPIIGGKKNVVSTGRRTAA